MFVSCACFQSSFCLSYITNIGIRIRNYCYFSRVELSWTELMSGNVLQQRWFYIVEKKEKSCFLVILLHFRRILKIAKSDISYVNCLSISPSAYNNSAATGQAVIQFYTWGFLKACQTI